MHINVKLKACNYINILGTEVHVTHQLLVKLTISSEFMRLVIDNKRCSDSMNLTGYILLK